MENITYKVILVLALCRWGDFPWIKNGIVGRGEKQERRNKVEKESELED